MHNLLIVINSLHIKNKKWTKYLYHYTMISDNTREISGLTNYNTLTSDRKKYEELSREVICRWEFKDNNFSKICDKLSRPKH